MSGSQDATLAALKKAFAPADGMRRIPLPLESYQHASMPLESKRLVNWFPEAQPADARSPVALVPTPGMRIYQTIGSGPIYAMDGTTFLYVVSGSHFYRFKGPGNPIEDLGYVGLPATDTGVQRPFKHTIAIGTTGVVVCVPPRAYTCTHEGPLNQIGGDFEGASSVAYIDGYFVFTAMSAAGKWFSSKLLDPSHYDALDFAYSDAIPNVLVGVITLKGEIWLMGVNGLEVWYDAGGVDFPFRRQSGGVVPYGTISMQSVNIVDGSIFWIGKGGFVYRSNGYQAERVSTHAIENIIRSLGSLPASTMAYAQNGHSFYGIKYTPSDSPPRDLWYDCATKSWAERASGFSAELSYRPTCATVQGDGVVFGDNQTGIIWDSFPNYQLEGDVTPRRIAVLPPLWAGTYRAFLNRLEIEMEVGNLYSPTSVLLEWSDDGGYTWNGSRTIVTGGLQQYRNRVVATRLGSFRERMFRMTTNGLTTVYGVDADLTTPSLA